MTLPRTSFQITTGLMGQIGTTFGTFSLKQVLLSTFEKILENILISQVNLFLGGPDSEKGLWKCVHANDHTWLSKDCSVVFNFICKVHYSG